MFNYEQKAGARASVEFVAVVSDEQPGSAAVILSCRNAKVGGHSVGCNRVVSIYHSRGTICILIYTVPESVSALVVSLKRMMGSKI